MIQEEINVSVLSIIMQIIRVVMRYDVYLLHIVPRHVQVAGVSNDVEINTIY